MPLTPISITTLPPATGKKFDDIYPMGGGNPFGSYGQTFQGLVNGGIVGLTGGAGYLDGWSTQEEDAGQLFNVISGSVLYPYVLAAGTDAQSLPDVVRPLDFNASTNPKVFRRLTPYGTVTTPGLNPPGYLVALSATSFVNRTLTGTAGQISITNGDGQTGSPIFSLPTSITNVNSITSQAATALTLATGTGTTLGIDLTPGSAGYVRHTVGGVTIDFDSGGPSTSARIMANGALQLTSSGAGNVVILGGASGASITAGQGANGGVTITPAGSGTTSFSAGKVYLSDTTDATDASGTTGSLGTLGGLSVVKKGYFGDALTIRRAGGGVYLSIDTTEALTYDFRNLGSGNSFVVGYSAGYSATGGVSLAGFGSSVFSRSTSAVKYGAAFGNGSLTMITSGERDLGIGYNSLNSLDVGSDNTGVGAWSLFATTGASTNTAVGAYSLRGNLTGSGSVALGYFAGRYATDGNEFYVNNQNRTDTAGDKAKSLLYGTFAADPLNQTLAINASTRVSNTTDATDATGATGSLGTLGGLSVKKSGWFGENVNAFSGIFSGILRVSKGGQIDAGGFGFLGIGVAPNTYYGLNIEAATSGSAGQFGLRSYPKFSSESTTLAAAIIAKVQTEAASFTIADAHGIRITSPLLGSGSSVTNLYGLLVDNQTVGGTSNYAIKTGTGLVHFGDTTDATDATGLTGSLGTLGGLSVKGKVYSGGGLKTNNIGTTGTGDDLTIGVSYGSKVIVAAATLKDGKLGVCYGSEVALSPMYPIHISGATSSTSNISIYNVPAIQSSSTSYYYGNISLPSTQAAAFTLPILTHFSAFSVTIGAGSAITTQTGFEVGTGIVGATNNYGFRGKIASGTGRYNLYMDGTAANLLAGVTSFTDATVATTADGLSGAVRSLGGASFAQSLWAANLYTDAITGTVNTTRLSLDPAGYQPTYMMTGLGAMGDAGSGYQFGTYVAPTMKTTGVATTGYLKSALAASSTTSETRGLWIDSANKGSGSTLSTNYALYISNQSTASTNYAIYAGTGLVRFGDTTDATDATGLTGSLGTLGGLSVKLAGRFGSDSFVNEIRIGRGPFNNTQSTAMGYRVLNSQTGGGSDSVFGYEGLYSLTTGFLNSAFGYRCQYSLVDGWGNTAFGQSALNDNVSGDKNVALGRFAGAHELGDNAFYVDNQDRSDTAGDKAGALIYGLFNSTPASQTIKFNTKQIGISTAQTPASASATGTTGTICWDASYVYVCTATDTWKRAAIATWP